MSEGGDGGPGKGQLGMSFVERKRAELTARLKGRDLSKRFRTSSEGSPGSNAALGADLLASSASASSTQAPPKPAKWLESLAGHVRLVERKCVVWHKISFNVSVLLSSIGDPTPHSITWQK